jgi:hypothetical protein
MIRHRPVDIGVEIPSRRGAGQRRVIEVESPGPDSIGQVSQSIEGYPTVRGQLTPATETMPAGPTARR